KGLVCTASFRQHQLGGDLLAHRAHLCPRCREDLTESLRGHLYSCAVLPEEVRQRAQDAREAARRLVKDSAQLRDQAEVLMREAEGAIAALRETMRRTVWRDWQRPGTPIAISPLSEPAIFRGCVRPLQRSVASSD